MGKRKKPPEPGNPKITSFFNVVNVDTTPSSSTAQIFNTFTHPESAPPPPKKTKRGSKKKQTSLPESPDQGDDDDEILPPSTLPTPPKQTHACNKTSFTSVFNPSPALRDLYVHRLHLFRKANHTLARHATLFLKYYILKYHSTHAFYPLITKDHFYAILYLLNKLDAWNPKATGKQDFAALRRDLLPYIRSYVRLVGFTPPRLPCDQQPIHYMTRSLNTNLTVNVSEHFMTMLLRYINLRLGE